MDASFNAVSGGRSAGQIAGHKRTEAEQTPAAATSHKVGRFVADNPGIVPSLVIAQCDRFVYLRDGENARPLDALANPAYLDQLDLSQPLTLQQVQMVQALLEQCELIESPPHRILWFDQPAAPIFTRVERLETFVKLLQSPMHRDVIPEKFRSFTHVDVSFLRSHPCVNKLIRDSSISVWRSSLFGLYGDVELICGTERIRVYRKFLNECDLFRPLLAQHLNQTAIDCQEIEPLLLAAGLDWVYANSNATSIAKDLLQKKILEVLTKAPDWFRELPESWWEGQLRYKELDGELCVRVLEYAEKAQWGALQDSVQPCLDASIARLICDEESEDSGDESLKAAARQNLLAKIGPKARHLDFHMPPKDFGARLGEQFPGLVSLDVSGWDVVENLRATPLSSNSLRALLCSSYDTAQFPLDCLKGCPSIEEFALMGCEGCEELSLQVNQEGPPLLQELKFLTLDLIRVDEAFLSWIVRCTKLENLVLHAPFDLSSEAILRLASLKLNCLYVKLSDKEVWTPEKIEALQVLGKVEKLKLASLPESLVKLAQEKLPNFNPADQSSPQPLWTLIDIIHVKDH